MIFWKEYLRIFTILVVWLALAVPGLPNEGNPTSAINTAVAAASGPLLYQRYCAGCHGVERLGGSGPALLPENLGRLKPEEAARVIRDGRPATQMPSHKVFLDASAVQTLTRFIFTPLGHPVTWDASAIHASHRILTPLKELPTQPRHGADPLSLFVVVETGDHHVSLLDGDRFEVLHRFPSHRALHGGPKFSAEGRFVYFASRDGWITKYDLYGFQPVAEVRVGINTRNLAISADGKVVAVANSLPNTLIFLDATDLHLLAIVPVVGIEGASRVSSVYQAAPRGSFIAALKDIPEVWEIRQDDPSFTPRRIRLDRIMDDFQFDPDYRLLIGAPREGGKAIVLNLDNGATITELPMQGLPHLNSGTTWLRAGRRILATPNLNQGRITLIDMQDWRVLGDVETAGPGFFMRSHEQVSHVWTDVMLGPQPDRLHLLDKQTLELAATLIPTPGKTAAHVEFDRKGHHALVSIWEDPGELVIYDTQTLREVKRLPMRKPSGKYNVYNKVTRSEGTSH